MEKVAPFCRILLTGLNGWTFQLCLYAQQVAFQQRWGILRSSAEARLFTGRAPTRSLRGTGTLGTSSKLSLALKGCTADSLFKCVTPTRNMQVVSVPLTTVLTQSVSNPVIAQPHSNAPKRLQSSPNDHHHKSIHEAQPCRIFYTFLNVTFLKKTTGRVPRPLLHHSQPGCCCDHKKRG